MQHIVNIPKLNDKNCNAYHCPSKAVRFLLHIHAVTMYKKHCTVQLAKFHLSVTLVHKDHRHTPAYRQDTTPFHTPVFYELSSELIHCRRIVLHVVLAASSTITGCLPNCAQLVKTRSSLHTGAVVMFYQQQLYERSWHTRSSLASSQNSEASFRHQCSKNVNLHRSASYLPVLAAFST